MTELDAQQTTTTEDDAWLTGKTATRVVPEWAVPADPEGMDEERLADAFTWIHVRESGYYLVEKGNADALAASILAPLGPAQVR